MFRSNESDMSAEQDVYEKSVHLDDRRGNGTFSSRYFKRGSISQRRQSNLNPSHCSASVNYVKLLLEAKLELTYKKSDAVTLVREAEMEYLEADSDLQKSEANEIRIEAMVALQLKLGVVLEGLEVDDQQKAFNNKFEAGKRKVDAKRKLELIKNNAAFDIEEAELLYQLKIVKIDMKRNNVMSEGDKMESVNVLEVPTSSSLFERAVATSGEDFYKKFGKCTSYASNHVGSLSKKARCSWKNTDNKEQQRRDEELESEFVYQPKFDKIINRRMSSVVGSLISMDHVINKPELQSVVNYEISSYEVNLDPLPKDTDNIRLMDAVKVNVEIVDDKVMENMHDGVIVFNDVHEQDEMKETFVDDVQLKFNDKTNGNDNDRDNVFNNEKVQEFLSIEPEQRAKSNGKNLIIVQPIVVQTDIGERKVVEVCTKLHDKLLHQDDKEDTKAVKEANDFKETENAEKISLFEKPVLQVNNLLLLNKDFSYNQQTLDNHLQENVNLDRGGSLDATSAFKDKMFEVQLKNDKEREIVIDDSRIQRMARFIWMPGKDKTLKFRDRESRMKKFRKQIDRKVLVTVFDPGKLMKPVEPRPKLLLMGLWRNVIGWEQGRSWRSDQVQFFGPDVVRPRMLLQGLWRCFIGWKMFDVFAGVKFSRAGV